MSMLFNTPKCFNSDVLNSIDVDNELFVIIGYDSDQNNGLYLEKYKPVSLLVWVLYIVLLFFILGFWHFLNKISLENKKCKIFLFTIFTGLLSSFLIAVLRGFKYKEINTKLKS